MTCRHFRRRTRSNNQARLRVTCAYLKGKVFLLDGDTIELNEERITIRPNEGKTDETGKTNDAPVDNMAASCSQLLSAITTSTPISTIAASGRSFSDFIQHGHFDLNASAADLVKEESPYKARCCAGRRRRFRC
jgi:hypothetical protein